GILDYTLFSDNKEFYSCYKMMNTRSGKVYNDNFELRVLELNSVELATEEDKKHKLDEWAKLFKAQTWEELKMIADKDPAMKSAVSSIYRYEADENVRKRCRDREDYLRNEYFMHRDLELTKNELDMTKSELEGTKSNLSKTKSELTEAKTELTETKSELTEAKSELTETKSELTEAKTELTETKSELTEAKSALYDLQEKNAQMADEIASLKAQLRSKNSVE
ncbi:MAG: PD-(D/E)XK nuclease family transposase, partial [Lachnospiraceae bacterium]|nr:PD-(D/E)XK nuclease family transposase [Lachnospiraceae bacterium]